MKQTRVGIVGAGISGLTAAYRLSQLRTDVEVLLFEAADAAGGKVRTRYDEECIVVVGADSFLARKPHGVALCEELGLADALIGRNPDQRKTHILKDGVLHDLPSGLTGLIPTDFAALRESSLLSAETITRLTQEPTIPAKLDEDDESVAAFFSRRFGKAIFEQLIQPLMGGIYGGDATRLSITAIFPQLRALEKAHGSVLNGLAARDAAVNSRYPPFVSLKNGMGQLIDALTERLPGGTLRLHATVQQIDATTTGFSLVVNGERFNVDALIVATSAPVASTLLGDCLPALSSELGAIEYGSSTIATFLFDHTAIESVPIGYGLLVPRSQHPVVLACSWSSNKWTGRAPENKLLARFFLRGMGSDDDLDALTLFQREQFGLSVQPEQVWIQRWPHAIPHYTLGHPERVAAIKRIVRSQDRLALAGAFFDGVGIPDCVRWGEVSAEKIAASV